MAMFQQNRSSRIEFQVNCLVVSLHTTCGIDFTFKIEITSIRKKFH
ncbi:unnamed protein product [Larinioides sclopetarius]|uniref:Uncharacterized protein n=1 Tax=Larinioides sclopetarius TaxID=280406 RepID=A0AAV1Z8T7_9ARAC